MKDPIITSNKISLWFFVFFAIVLLISAGSVWSDLTTLQRWLILGGLFMVTGMLFVVAESLHRGLNTFGVAESAQQLFGHILVIVGAAIMLYLFLAI